MFSSKIKECAAQVGVPLKSCRSFEALDQAPEKESAKLIIVDLEAKSFSLEGLKKLKESLPDVRVTCFFAHVNEELADQAASAGADVIYTRGQFVRVLPDLLRSL